MALKESLLCRCITYTDGNYWRLLLVVHGVPPCEELIHFSPSITAVQENRSRHNPSDNFYRAIPEVSRILLQKSIKLFKFFPCASLLLTSQ
jgi:hypothetical protein